MRAAELVEFPVVKVRLTTYPQRSHFYRDHVIAFTREKKKIQAIANRKFHPQVMIEHAIIHVGKPLPGGLHYLRC